MLTWSVGIIIPIPCILDIVKIACDGEVHEKTWLTLELKEFNFGLRISLLLHIYYAYCITS